MYLRDGDLAEVGNLINGIANIATADMAVAWGLLTAALDYVMHDHAGDTAVAQSDLLTAIATLQGFDSASALQELSQIVAAQDVPSARSVALVDAIAARLNV